MCLLFYILKLDMNIYIKVVVFPACPMKSLHQLNLYFQDNQSSSCSSTLCLKEYLWNNLSKRSLSLNK